MASCSDSSCSEIECMEYDQEAESTEYRSYRSHYADLLENVGNPTILAARLYSAGLLSRHARDKINELTLREQKATELLVATDTTIRLEANNFYKFVEALEKDSSMQHLCGKLRSTCAQLKSHTPQLVSSLPPNTSATAQQTTCYHPPPQPHSAPLEEPVSIVDLSKVPDGTLDNSHLSVLVTALTTVYQWFPLGIHLGLSHPTLKTIEENNMRQVERCRIDMLDMWLKGSEENRSKQVLQSALKQLTPQLVSSLPPNTSATAQQTSDSMLPSSSSITRQSSLSPPPNKSAKMSDSDLPSSSITSSSHSSTTAIIRKQYKQFLKDCYQQPLPDDDKLLTTASKHYIELAVISKKGITSKQADEFTKKSLHGLTEEILRKKAPIELKHILKPRNQCKPLRCVLVEGAPGIGKSTLAWEVCHKWEELESVKQYELVVLVCLREKKAQEAHCLGDLLPCDATTNMKELLAAIGRGKGMLIVCDGFDELPREQRQEGSVYIDLLKGRLLPEATIIVTSRPSVSADLWSLCQHNIHRHLEVIGFTKEDIKQFAESVFSGDILAGFLSYITSNLPIYGMMYIPLNAVIVALIYQDSYDTDTPFPTTMTELFDALTRALIRRQLVSTYRVPNEYCMPPSLQRTEDISKLPPLVAQQLLQLARVAYERLLKERYVFTDLGGDFEHLGMMKKTTSLNVCTGPGCSYSFLHLTLQEYLTALHIAIVNPSGFELAELLGSVVVRFLAGICRNDDYHSHPVYQELVQQLGCTTMSLQVVHCAYECPSIMDSVQVDYSEDEPIRVEPVVGFDWYATGYCISHFDERWELVIVDGNAREDGIDLLVKGLKSSPVAIGRIRSLFISSLSVSQVISQLRVFCQLDNLVIQNSAIDHNEEVVLQQLISPESELRKLQVLETKNVDRMYEGRFIPIFFQQSSLQELTMCIGNGVIIVRTELFPFSNTNLKELTISRNLLHPLAALIVNITSLIYLWIDYLLDSDLPVLTNIVQSHRTLEVLEIGENPNASIETLTFLQLVEIAGNSRLKRLSLYEEDYNKLPPHIHKRYGHLLEPNYNSNISMS